METPASIATSSRRSPFTRRLPPYAGKPACWGVRRARRVLRKSRISARRSISPTPPTVDNRLRAREALSVPGTSVTPAVSGRRLDWGGAPKQEPRRDPGDHPHQLLHDPARQLGDLHRAAEDP